jgi:hypothetical protein
VPASVADAIDLLARLRAEVYEDLNQLQHEYLIVVGARWLLDRNLVPSEVQWLWNPRQTGDHLEPDLAALYQGRHLISAEITASAKPSGVIDTRMARTLAKLSEMEGERYYFVRTTAMRQRAITKVARNVWPIQVVLLGGAGAL